MTRIEPARRRARRLAVAFAACALTFAGQARADDSTLKVYLLLGQSNMLGEGYAWDNFATDPTGWNVPTLEHLANNQAYYDSLPDEVFSFKEAFDGSWLDTPRNDAWAIGYNSSNGANMEVRNTEDTSPGDNNHPNWDGGVQPVSVGFGHHQSIGSNQNGTSLRPPKFGPELGLGHSLGDAMDSPLMFFKSSVGGTDLAYNWRPPSTAADRGGSVGSNYTNSMNRFVELLDQLDQDLADGVLDDKYDGATGYEVAGVVWLQGWNTTTGSQTHYTTAQKVAEYADNLEDLIGDIRAHDARIPADLPIVVAESSDQNEGLNAERQAGVDAINAATPGSAVFIEMNGLKDVNYGGPNAAGGLFTNGYGYHFHARAENFLEIGYRIGDAIVANGFTGSETLGALPGDTDGDGDVDDADLGVAFANYTGPLADGVGNKTAADGATDGDGDVDDADLGNAFAAYTGPLAAAVPEPASLTLIAFAGACLAQRRRR